MRTFFLLLRILCLWLNFWANPLNETDNYQTKYLDPLLLSFVSNIRETQSLLDKFNVIWNKVEL